MMKQESAPSDGLGLAGEDGRRPALRVVEIFAVLLFLLVVWFAGKVLLVAFGGVLVGVFLYSLAKWISDSTRLPYGLSLALIVVLLIAVLGLAAWLVGSTLVAQVNELAQAVPSSLKQIRNDLEEYEWGRWILEQSPQLGRAIAQGNFPSRITDLASSLVDLVLAIVIMLFIGLYGATEPNVYLNGLIRLVPLDRRDRAREVFAALTYNMRWWLLGQIFAMVCVGLFTGISVRLVGAPLPLALGCLAGLLEIIPNIGPVLWLVPAVLVALTQSTGTVVNVVIIYAITHGAESYVLVPLVQRRAVFLPPVLSILSVVLLGLLAGALGLLVAAPMALVVMILIKMLYVEDRLGDQTIQVAGEGHH